MTQVKIGHLLCAGYQVYGPTRDIHIEDDRLTHQLERKMWLQMMDTHVNFSVRVIADYQAPFADPIRANAGDEVVVDPDKHTGIPGWVWCTNRDGKSGWVPTAYVEYSGKVGKMMCDYDAIELTVHVGEILTVHKAESDFYWVTDQKGLQGWVPMAHVQSCENESEAR